MRFFEILLSFYKEIPKVLENIQFFFGASAIRKI